MLPRETDTGHYRYLACNRQRDTGRRGTASATLQCPCGERQNTSVLERGRKEVPQAEALACAAREQRTLVPMACRCFRHCALACPDASWSPAARASVSWLHVAEYQPLRQLRGPLQAERTPRRAPSNEKILDKNLDPADTPIGTPEYMCSIGWVLLQHSRKDGYGCNIRDAPSCPIESDTWSGTCCKNS